MKMKKLIAMSLCTCLFAGVLSGCGQNQEAAGSAGSGDSSAVSNTESASDNSSTEASDQIDYTQGDSYTITIGTGVVMGHPCQLAITRINEELTEITGGRIKLAEYHNSQLGSENELLEQVNNGIMDMTLASGLSNYIGEYGIFDMPYLFENYEHANAVLKSETGQYFLNLVEENTNMYALGFGYGGFRDLTTNTPINGPEDLVGMKIRVLDAPVYVDAFTALGALPTPMAFTELYTALQQGTVDGHDNMLNVIESSNLDSVQKYLYLTEHILSSSTVVIRKDLLDSMSESDQALIRSMFEKLVDYSYEYTGDVEQAAIDAIRERGNMTVVEDVDKEAFADIMRTIYPQYEEEHGKEMMDSIINFEY